MTKVTAAATAAGLAVGEREGTVIHIDGRWRELDVFFHRRHIPDAMNRLVAWMTDQTAGRDPRARLRHYMADDA